MTAVLRPAKKIRPATLKSLGKILMGRGRVANVVSLSVSGTVRGPVIVDFRMFLPPRQARPLIKELAGR